MTNPNEMQAGPELDAAIAVEVMEWRRVIEDEEQPDQVPYLVGPEPGDVHYPSVAAKFPDSYTFPVQFSTDIAAAWEVLEKLKDDSWYINVSWNDTIPGVENYWSCWGWRSSDTTKGSAPTAPLAICRAALAAVRARNG